MKTHFSFREPFLVFLLTVFILGAPFASLAQQNLAERQAKQDAKNDVNELAWFAGGILGATAFWGAISLLNEIDLPTDTPLRVLAVIVPFVAPGYAIFDSPTPPIERLVGKSPEYVNAYVDAYAKETKRRRVVSSTGGCVLGCFGFGLYLFATEPMYP